MYQLKNKRIHALKKINLSVESGEMLAICGPSGSGKSTLMNIVGLLDKINEGEHFFCGHNINDYTENELARLRNQTIGFVFQSFFLMPRMTVLQNILLPLTYQHPAPKNHLATQLLDQLQISHVADHLPNQLSGGQQQRVAIARALITQPKLILADEPTGALDPQTSESILDIFTALHLAGHTIIIITHDNKVSSKCKRVVEIKDGMMR